MNGSTTFPPRRPIAALALATTLVACGGGGEVISASVGQGSGSSEAGAPATVAVAASSAPAATAPAAPAAAGKPRPAITSLGSEPLDAGALRDAYFHWQDELVTVAGHPLTFFETEDWRQVEALSAVAERDAPALVACEWARVPEGKTTRTDVVVVRGRFVARSWAVPAKDPPQVELRECELLAGAPVEPAGDPWQLDGRPVPVAAFHDAVFGWQGQRVRAVGHYDSSTYSSASDTTRHDLARAGGGKVLGCESAGQAAAPASAVAERDGVVVEGVVGEPAFGAVGLRECRFVNRS